MKKVFAVLMSLALVLSMGTLVFAVDAEAKTGSITITNAMSEATYEVYKMLDFAPSNDEGTKGIYTIATGWEDFFETATAKDFFEVVTVGDQTTVVLKEGVADVNQVIAKEAIAYAEENLDKIDAPTTATAPKTENDEATATVEFTNLPLGYYAIDTSLGTLCALTNTNSTFTTTEKNQKPDIDKLVQEDSKVGLDDEWGTINDADIDQQVNYKSTVTVGIGATNYKMHDTMEAGLTFNDDVVVKAADGSLVDETNYEVIYPAEDGHTFDVVFSNDYIEKLTAGTQITVFYSATLNEDANIVEDGNDNTVYLSYGEDSTWETAKHTTSTYTWKMDVVKVDGETDATLSGATFELLDANGDAISFSKVEGAAVPTYMVDEEGTESTITTDENGKFEIIGLDEGTYSLNETYPPTGYNKLGAPVEIVITSGIEKDENENEVFTYKINAEEPATIEVENFTGGLFPETGGIGTTIFYIVGAILMIAAAVILVSKKRMASFA